MKCKYCGNEFIPKSYNQVYCSDKCRIAYWDKERPKRHSKGYYRKYNKKRKQRLKEDLQLMGSLYDYQGRICFVGDTKYIWEDEMEVYVEEGEYRFLESLHPYSSDALGQY